MADDWKTTSLALPSISIVIYSSSIPTNKSRERNNTRLNIRQSKQAIEALHLRIKLSAGHPITDLCHRPSTWLDMLNQLGKKGTRTENTESVKHQKDMGIPEGAAMAEPVSCSRTTLAGQCCAMLAQRWWDRLKIWKDENFIDLLAAN